MHKLYIFILAAFFVNISVSHANLKTDSIGVENFRGKKLIVYKVGPKETYYSISKKYDVSYKEVMEWNDKRSLAIGTIIKIPTEIPFAAPAPPANNEGLVEYTIKAKDNLNMLAEKYGTTVNEIKRVNKLNSINLQVGQVLKIPTGGNVSDETPAVTQPLATKHVEVETTSTTEHTIKAKENLNMLAEKYGTTVDELKRLNGLTSNNLRIGQVLKVPASAITEPTEKDTYVAPVKKPEPETPKNVTPVDGTFEHIVATGETIYSIAKKYNQTTYQIKSLNNLNSNEVSVGQKLMIKGAKTTAADPADDEPNANTNTIKDPNLKYPASRYGITKVEEKGTAVWISDPDLDATKMLVLHRTAPVGTIINITNPMTNRTTFAKVVGKFTENETTKDVIIVITKAVADAVGALDKRFFCNINYGAQENEQR